MRIGMILSTPLPPREGIGSYAWNLACFLRDRGHDVELITRGGVWAVPAQKIEGMTIHRPVFAPLYPFHAHFHSMLVSNLVKSLRDSLDVLHLHSPLVLPPKTDLPMLVTVHAPVAAEFPTMAGLGRAIERELFHRADRIAAISQAVAGQLGAFGLEPDKIPVAGNGVLTDFFVPPPPRAFLPERPVFLAVGQLAPGRGFDDFIRACQKVHFVYPNIRFLIIGGGPLETDFRSEINRHRLDGVVRLAGAVTDRLTLSIFYQNAYAFVQPSPGEKLSNALLEAMSCGRAVIAADMPGARDVIVDGENGLLVPPRRPDEMAKSMLRLVEYPELATLLGEAARQKVKKDYSFEAVGEQYLAAYQAILEQRR